MKSGTVKACTGSAFVLAGTESLVMSLWPLSDYIARATMVSYYAGLRDGLGRGEALRQAKLSMIKRKGRQHPYYWAASSSLATGAAWMGSGEAQNPRRSHHHQPQHPLS